MPLDADTVSGSADLGPDVAAAPSAARSAVQDAGGVARAIPLHASAVVTAFRPSLTRAIVGDPPNGEWTWETIATLAERAPTVTPGVYGYAPSVTPVDDLIRYLVARRGPLAQRDADGRLQVTIDDPQIVALVAQYLAMVEPLRAESLRWYDPDGAVVAHLRSVIADGRVALWLTPSETVDPTPDYAIAPWPSDGSVPLSVVVLDALTLRADSPMHDACRRAVRAIRPMAADRIGVTPVDDRPPPDPLARAVWRSLTRPAADDRRVRLPAAVRRWLAQALDDVWNAPPAHRRDRLQERLEEVQRSVDTYLFCMRELHVPDVEQVCARMVYPTDPWWQRVPMSGDPPTGD